MANTFLNKKSQAIGTAAMPVGGYTVPAATTSTLIGLSVANRTTGLLYVAAFHRDAGGVSTYLIDGAPLPAGSALVIVGGDQKVVMTAGDSIHVQASAPAVDAFMSLLETT